MCFKFAEKRDLKCPHYIHTNGNYEMRDMLTNLIMVIISQCICILNYHIVHLYIHIVQPKYIKFLFANHTSINLEKYVYNVI